MNASEKTAYPGENASLKDIFALAEEYKAAAEKLKDQSRKGKPLSRAPSRICAVHAIELYLNAFLMHHGKDQRTIRGISHNLAERSDLALENGLILREGTIAHLRAMTEDREYLVLRYGPELAGNVSEPTRLFATLTDVSKKVRTSIENDAKILG